MRRLDDRILIDRAAAANIPDERATGDFLSSQRVFVSSVMAGLEDERRAAADAIENLGAEPVWFEAFGGRDDDPEAAYLSEVASSTIYVGILGHRYGRLLRSRRSATHEEYREAEKRGLRISVWTVSQADWDGDQQVFVDEVRAFHTTGSFTSQDDLARGIRQRLRKIAAEELSPWCKLGSAVFRAKRIRMNSRVLEVEALVLDEEVAAYLESLRPSGWAAGDVRFTDPARSVLVRVTDVESTMRLGARPQSGHHDGRAAGACRSLRGHDVFGRRTILQP